MFRPPAARTLLLGGAVLAAAWAAWLGWSVARLPSVEPLRNPRASFVITVKDWRGRDRPFVLGPRNPHWTPIAAVPVSLRKAVVAAEDAHFYTHEGVDYEAIKEALKADIRKGRFVRGGSTITQQVAKNVFLSREKTLSRKIKEFVLARRIDDRLSKARILELYLNVVELGPMVYGVGHAARYYFGKAPAELSLRECAMLAAMLPGPKVYDPYRRFDRVLRRSDRILRRMRAAGMIGEDQFREALAEMPNLAGLERKVERTMAAPPPAEPPLPAAPDGGPRVLDPGGAPGGSGAQEGTEGPGPVGGGADGGRGRAAAGGEEP